MATISKYQTAGGTTLYRVRYRTPDRGQTQKRGFTTKRDGHGFGLHTSAILAKELAGVCDR